MIKAIKYEVKDDWYLAEYAVPEGIRIHDHKLESLTMRLEVWEGIDGSDITVTLLDSEQRAVGFEEVCSEFFKFALKCTADFSESVRRHKKFGV